MTKSFLVTTIGGSLSSIFRFGRGLRVGALSITLAVTVTGGGLVSTPGSALSSTTTMPAQASVVCSKGGICPKIKMTKGPGRIAMFPEIDMYGVPYGKAKYLDPGESNRDKGAKHNMKEPDYLLPMAPGGQNGRKVCLFRSDAGKDTGYGTSGTKIKDTERHNFYTTFC